MCSRSLEEKLSAIKEVRLPTKQALLSTKVSVSAGCLLIYLAVFIGLNGNMKTLLMFDLLGYEGSERSTVSRLTPYICDQHPTFLVHCQWPSMLQGISRLWLLQTGWLYAILSTDYFWLICLSSWMSLCLSSDFYLFKRLKIRDDNRQ